MRRPPRLLEWWLLRRLPPDFRGAVAGDLQEEFTERAERSTPFAGLRARIWYAVQVVSLDASALARVTGTTNGEWARDEGQPTAERVTRSGVMDMLMQDVRYAVRRLLKSPGFTLVAILSLGLGIGANSALFTMVNAVFRQDTGISEPDRVAQIYWNGTTPYWSISWSWYRGMRDDLTDVFSHTSATRLRMARTEPTGDALVSSLRVSGDYFGAIGVAPRLGRTFEPGAETDVETGAAVVVLSHDFWTRVLAGDPEVIGSTLRIEATPHTVLGVLPEGFTGQMAGVEVDIYLPDFAAVASPGTDNLMGVVRLQPGVSADQARAGLARLAQDLNVGRPEDRTPIAFTLVPQSEVYVIPAIDPIARQIAGLLFLVVGLVLVIACTNLASFLLTRAADRRREFAVRRAVGASRGRVVGQLLVESLLLAGLGGVVGITLGQLALNASLAVDLPVPVSLRLDTSIDLFVLGTTLGATVVAGILFGLFPAVTAGREDVAPVLRDESTGAGGGRGKVSLRGALVVAQVSLSLALLIGAGFFLRSLLSMTRVDPGFDREDRAVVTVDPGNSGYDLAESRRIMDDALRMVREMPEIESATMGNRVPMQTWIWRSGIRRSDQPFTDTREYAFPQIAYVTDGYFETLGIDIVSGRPIGEEDVAGAPPVVVVNRALARELWPDDPEGAVGRSVLLQNFPDSVATVVGIAPDVKVTTLDESPTTYMYQAQRQVGVQSALLVARPRPGSGSGDGATKALAERLRREIKTIDPDMYVHTATTVETMTGTTLFIPRVGAALLALFGALAVVMASIGLYGLVAFGVKRREKEVGIRLSLGADPARIVRTMMAAGTRLVVIGVAIGLALGVGAGALLEDFLFGISRFDPITLVAVPLLLLAIAVLASWIPARRAASIDPVESLRRE